MNSSRCSGVSSGVDRLLEHPVTEESGFSSEHFVVERPDSLTTTCSQSLRDEVLPGVTSNGFRAVRHPPHKTHANHFFPLPVTFNISYMFRRDETCFYRATR